MTLIILEHKLHKNLSFLKELVTNSNLLLPDSKLYLHKVIIKKSRGEGSLMEQDTIENVS